MESQLTVDGPCALNICNHHCGCIMRLQGYALDDHMSIKKDVLIGFQRVNKKFQERDKTRVWRRVKWIKDKSENWGKRKIEEWKGGKRERNGLLKRIKYDSSIHSNSFDHPIK